MRHVIASGHVSTPYNFYIHSTNNSEQNKRAKRGWSRKSLYLRPIVDQYLQQKICFMILFFRAYISQKLIFIKRKKPTKYSVVMIIIFSSSLQKNIYIYILSK